MSAPLDAFRENLGRLLSLGLVMRSEISTQRDAAHALRVRLKRITEKRTHDEADISALEKHWEELDVLEKRNDALDNSMDFSGEWFSVMIVTFVEAYLQDILVEHARRDPQVMADSKFAANYDELVAADSLDEVTHELRMRWANNFLSNGGPTRWAGRLRKMGASGITDRAIQTMEELWGVRHVVVHRAGHATHDFCRRHPSFPTKPGQRISAEVFHRFSTYADAAGAFVEAVDLYFNGRFSQPT